MASTFSLTAVLLLITIIHTATITAVPETEYNSLLSALRNRGYHVFANAITTTDLYYDIISGKNFTFFAPVDSVLYTLDMSMSAGDYTTTMRFHVVPHRLSFSDLRNLPYGLSSFPTLLNDHEMRIVNPMPLPLPIIVEGVYIAVPDLYYDTHVVVHGLESIIDFRSRNDTVNSSSVSENLTPAHAPSDVHRELHAPSPQAVQSSVVTGIDTVGSPVLVPVPQPETKSGPSIQSIKPPETKSGAVSQSIEPPETKSESIIQTQRPPETYFESITQPLEEHATVATRSPFVPQRIHHVSLATKSTGNNEVKEFTPVDDTVVNCPITDDERPQLSIANIRRGDPYMRELYTPTEMTCAQAS